MSAQTVGYTRFTDPELQVDDLDAEQLFTKVRTRTPIPPAAELAGMLDAALRAIAAQNQTGGAKCAL